MTTLTSAPSPDWGGRPYYSLDYYLKETFGQKVYKLALDGGMTCPNRDGSLATGGCIFCSSSGSGDFAAPAAENVWQQIESAKAKVGKKIKDGKYIAYFQSHTNTYAPVAYLRPLFEQALSHPDIAALSIGTRPDCLPPETVSLLKELDEKGKPVWVELGLQTIHSATARLIRRHYELPCFVQAVRDLKKAGLTVIVHVILGLPGETRAQILETIDYLGHLAVPGKEGVLIPAVDGIKLQLLHILEGTRLAALYRQNPFPVMEPEEYFSLVAECIRRLPPEMVIHRLSGDGPKSLLIAPLWSGNKRFVLNSLSKILKEEGVFQGQSFFPGARLPSGS